MHTNREIPDNATISRNPDYSYSSWYIRRRHRLLFGSGRLGVILPLQLIMLQDIHHLPWVIHPDVGDIHPSKVGHASRDLGGFFLELVVNDKDAEICALCETGAFRFVLDECELGVNVLDELFQGVSVGKWSSASAGKGVAWRQLTIGSCASHRFRQRRVYAFRGDRRG